MTYLIKIKALKFWSDYTDIITEEIDEKVIFGFEIHYRLSSWHIILVGTKETDYFKRDIGNQVYTDEIKKLIDNPLAKILKIVNGHSSDKFVDELKKVIN